MVEEKRHDLFLKIDAYWNRLNVRINRRKTQYSSVSDMYHQKILDEKDLKNNELPQTIERALRVDKSQGPWQKYVHEIIQDMLNSEHNRDILKESIYGDLSKIKVYLSDNLQPNAFVLRDTKPPILILTKGLFIDEKGKARPIDGLAYVIGHELGHQTMTRLTQEEKSSQFQESGSDTIGIYLANNAGYSPDAFIDLLDIQDAPQSNIMDRAFDIHPVFEDRVGVMRDVIGIFNAKNTISPPSPKKFSDADIETIKNVRVLSVIEDLFNQTDYYSLPENEKKEALQYIMRYLVKERPDILTQNFNLLHQEIEKLPVQLRNDIGHDIVGESLYTLELSYNYKLALAKLCLEQELEEEVARRFFLKNKAFEATDEQIIQQAYQSVEFYNKYLKKGYTLAGSYLINKNCYTLYSDKELFDFTSLKKHTLNDGTLVRLLKWEPILQCRDRASLKDKEVIDQMMSVMNINIALEKTEEKFLLINHRYVFKSKGAKRFLNLVQNQEDVDLVEKNYLIENEKLRSKRVTEINWDLMNTDLPAFIQTYKQDLLPDFTFFKFQDFVNNHEIAERFTQKLSELYNQNKELYGPIIDNFYANELSPAFINFRKNSGYDEWYDFYKTVSALARERPKLCIGAQHPYIQFLKTDAGRQINTKNKVCLINRLPINVNQPLQTISEKELMDLFNIQEPQNIDELYAYTKDLADRNVIGKIEISSVSTCLGDKLSRDFLKKQQQEWVNFFKVPCLEKELFVSAENSRVMERIVKRNMEYLLHGNLNLTAPDELSLLCREYILYNTKMIHPYALGQIYQDLNDSLAEKIMDRFNALKETQKDFVFEFAKMVLKQADPKYPLFRNYLIEVISDIHADKIGKEGIDKETFSDSDINADFYLKEFPASTADKILSRIMEKSETQRETSYRIEEQINQYLGSDKTKEFICLREGLRYLYDSQDLNMDLIEFLTTPVTQNSAAKLLGNIREKASDRYKILDVLQNPYLEERSFYSPPDSVLEYSLLNFHRFFWNNSEYFQSLLIKNILFKYHETISEKSLLKAYNNIKAKLTANSPYADEQKLILDTYYKQCGRTETRAFLVAALYILEEPQAVSYMSQKTENFSLQTRGMRLGKMLGRLLSKMGPAGGKLLQAIHSYPGTPQSMREDLKESKSNFNPPKRYEIFHALDRIYQLDGGELKGTIGRVGKLLGSGSFAYTVVVEGNTPQAAHSQQALTLIRRDVERDANEQFDRFFRPAIMVLALKNPKLYGSLPSILKQARHLTAVEADFITGGKQIQLAEQIYKGLSVRVGGQSFNIKTAHLDSFGRGYKKTELARGMHFNDLPETTKQEKAFKLAAAKAIFCTELYVLLQCGPIDSDRHGAQVRINGNDITLFDHGAIDFKRVKQGEDENGHGIYTSEVVLPSQSDKKCLGKIIGQSLAESVRGKPFADVLINRLNHAEDYSENKHFLATVQRALLALGDYMNAMGETPEEKQANVADCIAAVMKERAGLDITLLNSIAWNTPPQVLKKISKTPSTKKSVCFHDSKISLKLKSSFKFYEFLSRFKGIQLFANSSFGKKLLSLMGFSSNECFDFESKPIENNASVVSSHSNRSQKTPSSNREEKNTPIRDKTPKKKTSAAAKKTAAGSFLPHFDGR